MRHLLYLLLWISGVTVALGQERSLFDSLQYRAEVQATAGGGDHSPLWLNANRYGLSSLKTANGYVRGAVERPLRVDDGRRWGIGYGVDVAVAAGFCGGPLVEGCTYRRCQGAAYGVEKPRVEYWFPDFRH